MVACPGPTMRHLLDIGVKRILRAVEHGVTWVAQVAGVLFLLLSFLITWTVISRKFGGPIPPAIDEIGGLTVAIGSTLVLAWGLRTKGHIRIDIVFRHFSPMWKAVLNVGALALIAVFACFMTWRTWSVVLVSAERNAMTPSELNTPLMWPQSGWAIGFSIFALYAVVLWASAFLDLLGGKVEEVAVRYGPEVEDSDFFELTGIGRPDEHDPPPDEPVGR